ncbi:MAG: hypothetical protein H0T44_12510 [Gemmatimonadales bacterium]|nr:hypothetical protein [Gemmatimonadales bacterium]MBA3556607.1 hypothetical protein [Gemmatimonadales bacterium]
MESKFTLEHHNGQYTVQRSQDRWYITLGPKAITSLEGVEGENEAALQARIRGWLDDHPQMPDSPDIVFGGG